MTTSPGIRRRHFLARMLGFLAGGAWMASKPAARDAQASDTPYLGEIRMFAGDFAPLGWKFCNGELLPIADHDALFSLIGTTYGGDGQVTFALPDLRGRAPVHVGPTVLQGQAGGQETVTLLISQMPAHNHALMGSSAMAAINDTRDQVPARNPLGWPHYSAGIDTTLAANAVTVSGGSLPHDNVMPSLGIHFIIAIEGVWPSPF